MPIVIDQFEIVRDEQQDGENSDADGVQYSASTPNRPALSPADIEDTIKHLARRALRLRAT